MDNLIIFPFALLSDSEVKKIFTSTLLPFDDYSQRKFLMHSQSCNYDQDMDLGYNIVNNRVEPTTTMGPPAVLGSPRCKRLSQQKGYSVLDMSEMPVPTSNSVASNSTGSSSSSSSSSSATRSSASKCPLCDASTYKKNSITRYSSTSPPFITSIHPYQLHPTIQH